MCMVHGKVMCIEKLFLFKIDGYAHTKSVNEKYLA